MAKVHNLDIYPHTGERSCLGCVDGAEREEAPEAPPVPAVHPGPSRPASPGAADRDRPSPVPATSDPIAEPPPVLVEARWLDAASGEALDWVPPGTRVLLAARAHHLEPQPAELRISSRAGGAAIVLRAAVAGGAIRAEWTPPAAGLFNFEVQAASARARSADLLVENESRPPLKLVHIGRVLRALLAESRVVARWFLEDLSYEHLCALAEAGATDTENDPAHMPRDLCLLPGMEGAEVREAQRALTTLGHPVDETGLFDQATKAAFLAWLPSVQPDRETPAPAARARVAQDETFAGLCSEHRIADWTDLWTDHAPAREDDPDLPGGRSFTVPARAQRRRGRDRLETFGRETAGAYGGLAFVPPVERVARTLVYEDGTPVELPSWLRPCWSGGALDPKGAQVGATVPRGQSFDVRLELSFEEGPTA